MSRWRNPRLVSGVVLVLAAAVAGGWLVATARDTTDYWVVRADVRAGEPVAADHLTAVQGRFESAGAGTLLRVADGAPRGVWAHDVAEGTLVGTGAVAEGARHGRELPLAVTGGSMPPDLTRGQRVDVWSGPADAAAARRAADRVLTEVTVLSVSRADGSGERVVVVDTGTNGPAGAVVSAVRDHLTLVRIP